MDYLNEIINEDIKEIIYVTEKNKNNIPLFMYMMIKNFKQLNNKLFILNLIVNYDMGYLYGDSLYNLILYYGCEDDRNIFINEINISEQDDLLELIFKKKEEQSEEYIKQYQEELFNMFIEFKTQEHKIDNNIICPITLEPIKDIYITKCYHIFEKNELRKIMSTICPMCRNDLSNEILFLDYSNKSDIDYDDENETIINNNIPQINESNNIYRDSFYSHSYSINNIPQINESNNISRDSLYLHSINNRIQTWEEFSRR